ncbi:MAG TPA: hypothetical protein VHV77_13900, partial [Pirellulales bacterium]|nr:hypothetical protein [Pirellulales bacterium]
MPLTVLESFMVADSRAGYSMMCDVELDVRGTVDRGAFSAALAAALARNPLFTCHVERGPGGALAWVPSNDPPPVQWLSLDAPLDASYEAVADLSSHGGLR